VNWTDLAEDKDKCLGVMNMVMNIWVPWNRGVCD
jgi:hypothetical protein